MGTGIPQTMLFRLLDSMGLPSETTLHDIRWGSEYEGTFYWDFEISGSVPFEHIKGGIAAAQGHRQPSMYFPLGGSSIAGQCKAGKFVWARAHYEGEQVIMHVGTGSAFELPQPEFMRRLEATTREWPLMNCVLDGVSKNDLMAGHQSNHITVAYVPEEQLDNVVTAFVAQALTQNMKVFLAK
ncbi:C-compound and carbohydrate metabolism [Vibrio variabilis]|uniref:C-compound and carbohydrate metabolism n=1 Tax=Vibrio variabilis TaxID=990271 RepID=A0ABQ0JHF1_9VIBR|nr:C-compound and carbohydrate metabolism [Vibrio variabilis]